jgi:hypothetical protein
MDVEKNDEILEIYQCTQLPYVMWMVTKDLDSYFINNISGEVKGHRKLTDLLAVQMYKNELVDNGWIKFVTPSVRIISPDGSIKEV